MKIYLNSYRKPDGEHVGYSFTGSQRDAAKDRAEAKRNGNTTETARIVVGSGKVGLLAALNHYASHADNG